MHIQQRKQIINSALFVLRWNYVAVTDKNIIRVKKKTCRDRGVFSMLTSFYVNVLSFKAPKELSKRFVSYYIKIEIYFVILMFKQ